MFYIASVLLALAAVDVVMAGVLAIFWRLHPTARGIKEMAASLAAGTIGALLAGTGATSVNFLLGFAGMVCFIACGLLAARSMRRLQDLPPLVWLEGAILALGAAGDAYFLLVTHNITGAIVLNSSIYVIVCGTAARHLLRERRLALRPGCRVLGYMFGTFAAASLFRAVYRTFVAIPTPVMEPTVSLDLAFVFLSIAFSISWSLGLIWTTYGVVEYKLRTANESLARFSGAVAHDLNTPLNAVIGYLEAIEYLPDNPAQRARFLASAREAAMRMNTFIHDLLEQSRFVRLDGASETANTLACVESALIPLRAKLEAVSAEVHLRQLHPVAASPFQVTRVFQNLFENAYKYRAPDRPLRIDVWSEREAGWVVMSVKDNGSGIAAQDHEMIFNSFERAHADTAQPGYGIGLSECRNIIESFDGTIHVESTLGEGSRFILRLPAAAGAPHQAALAEDRRAPMASAPESRHVG